MKIILLSIFITLTLFASPQPATKDDIKMLIHQMDKRFEQVDKRFEQVDKRLEMIQKQMDKRFEQVDKRFEENNRRFELMQQEINNRFDTQFYLIIAGFTLILGYLLKERTIISTKVKEEIKPELIKKADKNILDKVIAIIEEMAKKDKEVESMLEKHHLRLA